MDQQQSYDDKYYRNRWKESQRSSSVRLMCEGGTRGFVAIKNDSDGHQKRRKSVGTDGEDGNENFISVKNRLREFQPTMAIESRQEDDEIIDDRDEQIYTSIKERLREFQLVTAKRDSSSTAPSSRCSSPRFLSSPLASTNNKTSRNKLEQQLLQQQQQLQQQQEIIDRLLRSKITIGETVASPSNNKKKNQFPPFMVSFIDRPNGAFSASPSSTDDRIPPKNGREENKDDGSEKNISSRKNGYQYGNVSLKRVENPIEDRWRNPTKDFELMRATSNGGDGISSKLSLPAIVNDDSRNDDEITSKKCKHVRTTSDIDVSSGRSLSLINSGSRKNNDNEINAWSKRTNLRLAKQQKDSRSNEKNDDNRNDDEMSTKEFKQVRATSDIGISSGFSFSSASVTSNSRRNNDNEINAWSKRRISLQGSNVGLVKQQQASHDNERNSLPVFLPLKTTSNAISPETNYKKPRPLARRAFSSPGFYDTTINEVEHVKEGVLCIAKQTVPLLSSSPTTRNNPKSDDGSISNDDKHQHDFTTALKNVGPSIEEKWKLMKSCYQKLPNETRTSFALKKIKQAKGVMSSVHVNESGISSAFSQSVETVETYNYFGDPTVHNSVNLKQMNELNNDNDNDNENDNNAIPTKQQCFPEISIRTGTGQLSRNFYQQQDRADIQDIISGDESEEIVSVRNLTKTFSDKAFLLSSNNETNQEDNNNTEIVSTETSEIEQIRNSLRSAAKELEEIRSSLDTPTSVVSNTSVSKLIDTPASVVSNTSVSKLIEDNNKGRMHYSGEPFERKINTSEKELEMIRSLGLTKAISPKYALYSSKNETFQDDNNTDIISTETSEIEQIRNSLRSAAKELEGIRNSLDTPVSVVSKKLAPKLMEDNNKNQTHHSEEPFEMENNTSENELEMIRSLGLARTISLSHVEQSPFADGYSNPLSPSTRGQLCNPVVKEKNEQQALKCDRPHDIPKNLARLQCWGNSKTKNLQQDQENVTSAASFHSDSRCIRHDRLSFSEQESVKSPSQSDKCRSDTSSVFDDISDSNCVDEIFSMSSMLSEYTTDTEGDLAREREDSNGDNTYIQITLSSGGIAEKSEPNIVMSPSLEQFNLISSVDSALDESPCNSKNDERRTRKALKGAKKFFFSKSKKRAVI